MLMGKVWDIWMLIKSTEIAKNRNAWPTLADDKFFTAKGNIVQHNNFFNFSFTLERNYNGYVTVSFSL